MCAHRQECARCLSATLCKPTFLRNRIYLNFQELDNKTAELFPEKQFIEVFGLLPELSCIVNVAWLQGRFLRGEMREGFQICSEACYKGQMKANSLVREIKLLMQQYSGDNLSLFKGYQETGMELRQPEWK